MLIQYLSGDSKSNNLSEDADVSVRKSLGETETSSVIIDPTSVEAPHQYTRTGWGEFSEVVESHRRGGALEYRMESVTRQNNDT